MLHNYLARSPAQRIHTHRERERERVCVCVCVLALWRCPVFAFLAIHPASRFTSAAGTRTTVYVHTYVRMRQSDVPDDDGFGGAITVRNKNI